MGIGDLCRKLPAAKPTGEPGKVQGRDHVEIVERSCGSRDRGVSIRAKAVLSKILGCEGVAIWLNVVLNNSRVAYPYVKVHVRELRELLRVVGIVAPFARRGAVTRGKFVISSPKG